MKHNPSDYAAFAVLCCLLALPAALAVTVFLLLAAALALCLSPIVAIAVYLGFRDAQRDERRARYGGPVPPEHFNCRCSSEGLNGCKIHAHEDAPAAQPGA